MKEIPKTWYLVDADGQNILFLDGARWLQDDRNVESCDLTYDDVKNTVVWCEDDAESAEFVSLRNVTASWMLSVAGGRPCKLVMCHGEELEGFWPVVYSLEDHPHWPSWRCEWPMRESDGSLTLSSGLNVIGAVTLLQPNEILQLLTGSTDMSRVDRFEFSKAVAEAWESWARDPSSSS